jgi:hypothetical protein
VAAHFKLKGRVYMYSTKQNAWGTETFIIVTENYGNKYKTNVIKSDYLNVNTIDLEEYITNSWIKSRFNHYKMIIKYFWRKDLF